MYWNDENLTVEPYERKRKYYFCGKHLKKPEKKKALKATIVVIDLSECYCANIYTDNEIEKVFAFDANVPHKHSAGGQSAQRFARIREAAITLYFKKINEKLSALNTPLIIAMNFIYRNRLQDNLSTKNTQKILRFETTEYGGETGVYQFRNMQ